MKTKPTKEVQLLNDIAKGLAESLDLKQTLRHILKSLDTHLRLQRGTITLLNPDTETINIEIAHGISEKSKKMGIYRMGEGVTGTVVQTGKEIIVPDISKDPRFVHKTGARKSEKKTPIAFFCVPIKLEGKTIGALSVDRQTEQTNDFVGHVRPPFVHLEQDFHVQPVRTEEGRRAARGEKAEAEFREIPGDRHQVRLVVVVHADKRRAPLRQALADHGTSVPYAVPELAVTSSNFAPPRLASNTSGPRLVT